MGAGANRAAGIGAARALRVLLLLVLALATVEYLFGFILEPSPFRTRVHALLHNATQPIIRSVNQPLPKTSQGQSTQNSTNATDTNDTMHSQTVKGKLKTTQIVTVNSSQSSPNMTQKVSVEDSSTLLISKIINSIKNKVITKGGEFRRVKMDLPLCDRNPTDLGPIIANKTNMELEEVEKNYPEVHWGGRYSPPNCTAWHKVAIIVPYRDRRQHLAIFLNHMHPFLMKQQIEYGIFIVEQAGAPAFNRAKLMNVGFVESQKQEAGGWECFIFHDVDLLPLDQRNMYSCPLQPRHMSGSIDKYNFKLPYKDIFGGVSALTLEQFTKVNGFSNRYWGWGGEDDDMAYRLRKMKYHVGRYKMSIARYSMLTHKGSTFANPKRYYLLSLTTKVFKKDGLSTLKYVIVEVVHHHLYTHIVANIDEHI